MPASARRLCRWKIFSLQQWQTTVATNLTAPFLCTQHAPDHEELDTRGGRIINNGSISAYAAPVLSFYTATKHAISGSPGPAVDGRA